MLLSMLTTITVVRVIFDYCPLYFRWDGNAKLPLLFYNTCTVQYWPQCAVHCILLESQYRNLFLILWDIIFLIKTFTTQYFFDNIENIYSNIIEISNFVSFPWIFARFFIFRVFLEFNTIFAFSVNFPRPRKKESLVITRAETWTKMNYVLFWSKLKVMFRYKNFRAIMLIT